MQNMKRLQKLMVLLLVSGFSFGIYAQSTPNKYGLKVINSYKDYQNSVSNDSANSLLNLVKYIPGIVLDIRYATKNNFLKEAVYPGSYAFARKPVVEALIKIQSELKTKGYGLKIFDAYRPYQITDYFYEKVKDTVFVAAPWKGSRHNRGCAVDLTLISLKDGKELQMPTPYDDFTEKAYPNYMKLPKKAIKNRSYLISVMEKHGFKVYSAEWWHFDFNGWQNFDLMDISFKDLDNN